MEDSPNDSPVALCQSCGQRPAAVEFVQVTGNERRRMALCHECAAAQGVEGQLDEFQRLAQLLIHQLRPVSQFPEEFQAAMGTVCRRCGLVFEQFVRTGLLGCPECYRDFHEILLPILRRLHGVTKQTPEEDSRHSPAEQDDGNHDAIDPQRIRLEAELHTALVDENFERAAAIRDELRKL